MKISESDLEHGPPNPGSCVFSLFCLMSTILVPLKHLPSSSWRKFPVLVCPDESLRVFQHNFITQDAKFHTADRGPGRTARPPDQWHGPSRSTEWHQDARWRLRPPARRTGPAAPDRCPADPESPPPSESTPSTGFDPRRIESPPPDRRGRGGDKQKYDLSNGLSSSASLLNLDRPNVSLKLCGCQSFSSLQSISGTAVHHYLPSFVLLPGSCSSVCPRRAAPRWKAGLSSDTPSPSAWGWPLALPHPAASASGRGPLRDNREKPDITAVWKLHFTPSSRLFQQE